MRKIFGLAVMAAASALGFAQPAAAQAATAQQCVTGPWAVFFAFDSDTITSQGAAILDKVAEAYRTCGEMSVVIAGHTDRQGEDAYNVGLSQRMANNVRDHLHARGLPHGTMTTQAFGETRPMLDTKDGVREPQNRRVEIYFGPGSGW